MNEKLIQLRQMFEGLSSEEYAYIALAVVILLYILHVYAQRQAREDLKKEIDVQVELYKHASDLSVDALCVLCEKNKILYVNTVMAKLLQIDKDNVGGKLDETIKVKVKQEWVNFSTFIKENSNKSKKSVFPEIYFRIFSKKEIPINLRIERIQKTPSSWLNVVSIENLSENTAMKGRLLRHQITHLPNQLQAMQDLPALYAKIHLEKNKIALVLMSFDNFVMLRSIIGYEQSTIILKKFAKYMEDMAKEFDISVYHTFDNHFLVTMRNVDTEDEVRKLIKILQIKLRTFYKMEESSLHLSLSAGIAVYPDSGSTRDLLDNAYKALLRAQKDGEGRVHVFEPEVSKDGYTSLDLHNDMKGSLDKGEFEVYYQPIVDAKTGEVVSAEALIRWIHPKYGFIPPDVFIHLMEKTGFIIHLGRFVLENVLRQQKRWEIFGFKKIDVAINVSMVEIVTGDFVPHAIEQVKHHNLQPEGIKFEITEGMAMMDEKRTSEYFHDLKKAGFQLSLDDFGTGYTSFTYLKKFPADFVKIDKSLVDYVLENKEDQRIVKAMIELGHTLGMKIITEGIETKEMAEMLKTFGSDYFQGYYFSKPLPVFEFQKLLR